MMFIDAQPCGHLPYSEQSSGEFLFQLVYRSIEFLSGQRFLFRGYGCIAFLFLELLLQQGKLSLGVEGELSVVYPAEIRRLREVYFPCRLAFMFAEIDDGSLFSLNVSLPA